MNKYLIILLLILPISVFSQTEEKPKVDHSYKPLTVKLSDDGKKFVRFIMWHQLWLTNQTGQTGPSFSIRRSRFLALAKISPRFLFLTHIGLNSLGANHVTANPNSQQNNNRSLMFLHDAWGEFMVSPELYIGAGLHYWNGVSRLSNQSTLNMLTLDGPGSGRSDARLNNWFSLGTSDQFARHLGIYAKGSLGKFSYRVAANASRLNDVGAGNNGYKVKGTAGQGYWNYAGYFKYDFFDKESTTLPYFVGTYMGKKKVLSVGSGFFFHPDAISTSATTPDELGTVNHFGVDVFYDAPMGKGAINALATFINYNYGGNETFADVLGIGTGSWMYFQLGYLLPAERPDHRIMPYAYLSMQNFKYTPNSSQEIALGINWFINGHFAKLTGEYTFGNKGTQGADITSAFRLQMHIFL